MKTSSTVHTMVVDSEDRFNDADSGRKMEEMWMTPVEKKMKLCKEVVNIFRIYNLVVTNSEDEITTKDRLMVPVEFERRSKNEAKETFKRKLKNDAKEDGVTEMLKIFFSTYYNRVRCLHFWFMWFICWFT